MKKIIITLLSTLLLLSLTSCEEGESTPYDETMVMYLHAKADSTITGLFLSRTATVNESITMDNLGIGGATIELLEKAPDSVNFISIGFLDEIVDSAGVYYLPSIDFPGGFKVDHEYRVEAYHLNYTEISAEATCPPPLTDIVATNIETHSVMLSMDDSLSYVDTLFYRRGDSMFDNEMLKCNFDPSDLLAEERLASFRIVPDDSLRYNENFWLEDTTKAVWDDYDIPVRMFKKKTKYGEDLVRYSILDISMNWSSFYHTGLHTIVFSST
ncbi:MAG: DUF4249 family protein, partial [Candidatus Delongbacteria bacterium]|nr:DUF4249 family protein [Candidatus Delongbacteria bacterium]